MLYIHCQVGRKFTSFVNLGWEAFMQDDIWLIVYSEGKKSIWPYCDSIKKGFLDFPMLCFHLPSVKNPAASP